MSAKRGLPGLSSSRLVGIVGGIHWDLEHLLIVAATMWARGVDVLVILGDVGTIWPGQNWGNQLDKLSEHLAEHRQVVYLVEGNSEDFHTPYEEVPVGEDGLQWLRPNVIRLPRGYRTQLATGRTLGVLGGANSTDNHLRVEGEASGPEEPVTDSDLATSHDRRVDVLLGHDGTRPLLALGTVLAENADEWPEHALAYASAQSAVFQDGFAQAHPALYLGGHYHRLVDEMATYGEDVDTFDTRVVLLDRSGPDSHSQAILNTDTLEVQTFTRTDAEIIVLTGAEAGVWHVRTRDSLHVFDLDAGTTERRPGTNAVSASVDHPRPLEWIRTCEIGKRGFWAIRSYDERIDYFWHDSAIIRSIERLGDGR